jgi:hypothetical protein
MKKLSFNLILMGLLTLLLPPGVTIGLFLQGLEFWGLPSPEVPGP